MKNVERCLVVQITLIALFMIDKYPAPHAWCLPSSRRRQTRGMSRPAPGARRWTGADWRSIFLGLTWLRWTLCLWSGWETPSLRDTEWALDAIVYFKKDFLQISNNLRLMPWQGGGGRPGQRSLSSSSARCWTSPTAAPPSPSWRTPAGTHRGECRSPGRRRSSWRSCIRIQDLQFLQVQWTFSNLCYGDDALISSIKEILSIKNLIKLNSVNYPRFHFNVFFTEFITTRAVLVIFIMITSRYSEWESLSYRFSVLATRQLPPRLDILASKAWLLCCWLSLVPLSILVPWLLRGCWSFLGFEIDKRKILIGIF